MTVTSFLSRSGNLHAIAKTTVVLGLAGLLAACGGGDLEIRTGPQAVHPSGSLLASGAQTVPHATDSTAQSYQVIASDAPCGHAQHCTHHAHHQTAHHSGGYHGNDGSMPIID